MNNGKELIYEKLDNIDRNLKECKILLGMSDTNSDEPFFEMATIAIDDNLNINVNPEVDRLSIAYFKVFNAESFRKQQK